MKLEVIDSKTWALHSEDAHKIAFGKVKPASWDRIDFALLAVDDSEMPMGYITCREHDHETIYWQFGGAFPGTKGTCKTWLIYNLAAEYCSNHYKRITTVIENTNISMLKMAMKLGFIIVGVRGVQGSVLLELVKEFSHD